MVKVLKSFGFGIYLLKFRNKPSNSFYNLMLIRFLSGLSVLRGQRFDIILSEKYKNWFTSIATFSDVLEFISVTILQISRIMFRIFARFRPHEDGIEINRG